MTLQNGIQPRKAHLIAEIKKFFSHFLLRKKMLRFKNRKNFEHNNLITPASLIKTQLFNNAMHFNIFFILLNRNRTKEEH
ncbi:hypothetical protein BpHYR1_052854 [Brachionus plicatilis]|uniref:Uncharacterized protein n=1 Tax=Brachionus plicatilis TaxID=10195 RepID=A0A3M7RIN2_BRAPC|nr:hypothetical protein BpHYR1_052854 [Brachionus plicatilis]